MVFKMKSCGFGILAIKLRSFFCHLLQVMCECIEYYWRKAARIYKNVYQLNAPSLLLALRFQELDEVTQKYYF